MTSINPPTYQEIIRFTIPIMLSSAIYGLMTLTDTIFIGKLGTSQLAAVPLASLVYTFGWILLFGIMNNSIAFIGRAYGAKEYHKISNILANYQFIALLGLPILILFIQIWPLFSNIAHLNSTVNDFAWTYLQIRVWDAPFSLLFVLYSFFHRAIGNSKLPMFVSFVVLVINIVLDYGLIFGNLGMPNLGVAGSAYATVFSIALSAFIIIIISLFGKTRSRFALQIFKLPNFVLLKQILRVGLPQGIGNFIEFIAWVGFALIVGKLGENSLAASNLGIQIKQSLSLPSFSMGIAAASYMSRFLGANSPNIARQTTNRILFLGIIYMAGLGIILWFFGTYIAQFFTTNSVVIYQAGLMFKVMALFQIFDGINMILRSALAGAGDTLIPTFFIAICIIVIMFPTTIILSQLVTPGIIGAYLGAFFFLFALAILMMYRYKSKWATISL